VTTTSRRLLLLLGAVAIAGAGYVALQPASNVTGGGASAPASANSQAARPGDAVGDVKLESLEQRDTSWSAPDRNVFRFENRREAATAPVARPPTPEPFNPGPSAPALPAPPPPIPLRYIGYLDQAGEVPRIAVLSDGKGNVFNGKEGDIIEGRYRVLRIGTDSADLIYVDGRGRQTIRLSGQ
jgi:hypothetical protein